MKIISLGSYQHKDQPDRTIWFGMTEHTFIYVYLDILHQEHFSLNASCLSSRMLQFSHPFFSVEEMEEKGKICIAPLPGVPDWISLNVKKAIVKAAKMYEPIPGRKSQELVWDIPGFEEYINNRILW